MKNHDPHIESLLELFMQGETSLKQERELNIYFASSTSIPEEWEIYRDLFAYFDAGMPIEDEKPKRHIARPLWALVAAAAIAAIAILVAPLFQRSSTKNKVTIPQPITVENKKIKVQDTIVKAEQPQASLLLAKQDGKSTKEKPHTATHHAPLDSIEIERERGEVEQAQQELMADKFIIEQERQEALDEQYITRTQAYQAQQVVQTENPQFIQVVFK